jgi:hypothetical protein
MASLEFQLQPLRLIIGWLGNWTEPMDDFRTISGRPGAVHHLKRRELLDVRPDCRDDAA